MSDWQGHAHRLSEEVAGHVDVDPRIIEKLRLIPRHRFVERIFEPEQIGYVEHTPGDATATGWMDLIYRDAALTIALDRSRPVSSSTAPWLMALMAGALDLRPGGRVLEIGTGTGYNAALLAELVRPRGAVQTLEIDARLAATAAERLAQLGYDEVVVHSGDGLQGWQADAPYEGIVITASLPRVPLNLLGQLAGSGRLVMNLHRTLAGGVVVIAAQGERYRGTFLDTPSVGFTPARNVGGTAVTQVFRCSADAAILVEDAERHGVSVDALDPSQPDLRAFLQFEFSELRIVWQSIREPRAVCLTDGREGVLLTERGEHVQAQGSSVLFQRLVAAIGAWEAAGRPRMRDLRLEIDGRAQWIALSDRYRWKLDEGQGLTTYTASAN